MGTGLSFIVSTMCNEKVTNKGTRQKRKKNKKKKEKKSETDDTLATNATRRRHTYSQR